MAAMETSTNLGHPQATPADTNWAVEVQWEPAPLLGSNKCGR